MDVSNLVIKEDIRLVKEDIKNLDHKLDKLMNTLDGFVGIVDDLRTENTVGTHHTEEIQLKIKDHEKRLKHLESSG